MNLYEGMFILDAKLSEEDIEKAIKELEGFITAKKGEIQEVERIGKRKLEYKIEKEKEGFYYLMFFKVEASEIASIRRKCKLSQVVYREMILQITPDRIKKFAEYNVA